MKTTTIMALMCSLHFSIISHSNLFGQEQVNHTLHENSAEHPCISMDEYTIIETNIQANLKALHLDKAEQKTANKSITPLSWPLRTAQNLHDCSYYHIAAYVDQDQATGSINDFNCGQNTYDGHRGTDISIWPYNFVKMENNMVEVIAAAAGTIVDVHDGEFDRNCSSNQLTANHVIIQHADGSVALYWHMKNGSVTTKTIGQTVEAGEYLGVVGSSGSSSGPHLHFEVWSGNTVATRIDPYAGNCNTLNAATWWIDQKPYKETGVMKVSVHTTDALFPPCPETETLNESTSYTIPFQGPGLNPGYAKIYMFIRDEVVGLTADLKILNPNGTKYLSWTYNSSVDSKVRTWAWSKVLPTNPGTYTLQATYNGIVCSSTFEISNLSSGINSISENSAIRVYPNPTKGRFTIERDESNVQTIEIFNALGELIYQKDMENLSTEIDLTGHSGIYIYKIKNQGEIQSIGKIVIE